MELPSSNTLVLVVLVVDGKICIFFFEAKSTDLNKFAVFGGLIDWSEEIGLDGGVA